MMDDVITEYIDMVKNFETDGFIPRGCNSSFIALVPKIQDPLHTTDYQPISLIGCQYKVIAKVLANHLLQVVAKAKDIFKGVKVGNDNVEISLLQFADDALILGEWSHENAKNLCRLLRCFHLASGLKVNFSKNKIFGVGATVGDTNLLASILCCQPSSLPFTYLGLPIGANMNRSCNWKPIIDKFHNRLSSWKARSLSFGGRLALLKSVLGALGGEGGRVWCDIVKSGEEIDGLGVEFTSLFVGMVRDGRDIRKKEISVVERGEWVDNRDRWKWSLSEDGEFTVKELSRLIEEKILVSDNGGQEMVWNKLVPKKVNIFVWRALRGRLPVRVELDRRGVDLDSVLCPSCNNIVETCSHSLITCDLAMGVWDKIFSWWKAVCVNAFSLDEFFSSNGNVNVPTYFSRVCQAVIWSIGYFIWKERNTYVFGNKISTTNKIVQDIQLRSYEWIVRRSNKYKDIDWQRWLRDPTKSGF
ncbi:RNA-directed DNA polymerase, eukaryota, reverse transcriptase zinc-binding domain protein [Tanacetum coccineum]